MTAAVFKYALLATRFCKLIRRNRSKQANCTYVSFCQNVVKITSLEQEKLHSRTVYLVFPLVFLVSVFIIISIDTFDRFTNLSLFTLVLFHICYRLYLQPQGIRQLTIRFLPHCVSQRNYPSHSSIMKIIPLLVPCFINYLNKDPDYKTPGPSPFFHKIIVPHAKEDG